MIKAENLSYPSTEKTVNQINYINIEKIYFICNNNLPLMHMIKVCKMF